jgi:uncharacterized protein (TIGR02246 family)
LHLAIGQASSDAEYTGDTMMLYTRRNTLQGGAIVLGGTLAAPLLSSMSAQASDAAGTAQAMYVKWDAAFNGGDAAALATIYVPDARVMPPRGVAQLAGHKAIEEYFAGRIRAGISGHALEIVEAQQVGPILFAAAKWRSSGPGENGARKTYGGNSMQVFERQGDGTWKIRMHLWNL